MSIKTIEIETIRVAIAQARIVSTIGRRPSKALYSELKGIELLARHIENVIKARAASASRRLPNSKAKAKALMAQRAIHRCVAFCHAERSFNSFRVKRQKWRLFYFIWTS